MWKWAFLALYFVIALAFYRAYDDALDNLKGSYYKDNIQMSKKHFDLICDFLYIFFSALWPILLIIILKRTNEKKENKNE